MSIYDSNEAEEETVIETEVETEETTEAEATEEPESTVEESATTAAEPKIEQTETDSKYEELQKQIKGLQQGIVSERQKRQEAERKKPGLFESPEEWEAEQDRKIQELTAKTRIDMSEYYARQKYEDYQEMEDHFVSIATPEIIQHMQNHPSPADYAYTIAKQHKELQGIGDISEYKEKLRKEILEEEQGKSKEAEKKQKLEKLPDSLSTLTAAADESPYVKPTASQLYD